MYQKIYLNQPVSAGENNGKRSETCGTRIYGGKRRCRELLKDFIPQSSGLWKRESNDSGGFKMAKKRWWIGAGSAAALGLALAFAFMPAKANHPADASFSGLVEQTEYDLSFKIDGRVAELSVQEGQFVRKGDLIGQLEKGEWEAKVHQAQAAVSLAEANLNKAIQGVGLTDRDSRAKVEQAQAALGAARAKFEALRNGARPEEISQLEARLEAAQSAYNTAEDLLNKMNALYNAGAVPQTKKDEAQVQYDKAKAELTSVRKQLEMARQGARQEELNAAKSQVEQAQAVLDEAINGTGKVNLSQSDVKLAESQLNQAKAALEEAETYLSYTRLVAPVDGVVIHRNVEPNEMVSKGFTAVTIADPNDKWVSMYVPETRVSELKVGQTLNLYVPAIKEQATGQVLSINQAPEFAVKKATNHLDDRDIRAFQVKIKLTGQLDRIFKGMTVEWQGAAQK